MTAPKQKPPLLSTLASEDKVLDGLRNEIAQSTLKDVAAKYRILPQQLSDVLHSRANLSKKMVEKMRLKVWRYYEKVR